MTSQEYMTVDGIPVPIEGEKNLLELIRKAGIELPTFCYHSDLSIYGACRMCMVENEWGGLDSACSAQPRPGMNIRTNTERLRKYRKMILELILANHCRDCTTCQNSGKCKLQDLAERFHMDNIRFPNSNTTPHRDDSSLCISKDTSKCILCGDCVRVCNEVQNVGAIDFAHRGSKMSISTAFEMPISESTCVGCGQCAAVCPTGAIVIKDDTSNLWKDLDDKNVRVIAQIAPAVRVAVGKEFGLKEGEDVMGKIVAAMHRLGFDEVFDTSTTADLTVIEEAAEFVEHLKSGSDMPLFTSCCPAWINFAEKHHPEIVKNISTCRSPMQMFASLIKEQYKNDGDERRLVHVAIMPCTAKKFEAARDEFKVDGVPNVDYSITTQELIRLIRESGINFEELELEAIDSPFGVATGAGVIFGTSGGVTEAVLRHVSDDKSRAGFKKIVMKGVRGLQGTKETTVMLGEKALRIAIVSGLKNASDLLKRIEEGEHYDLVEVMACPGGCVSGAGQPYSLKKGKELRAEGLYASDRMSSIKSSEQNPVIPSLYEGILKGRTHELLHVHYNGSHE